MQSIIPIYSNINQSHLTTFFYLIKSSSCQQILANHAPAHWIEQWGAEKFVTCEHLPLSLSSTSCTTTKMFDESFSHSPLMYTLVISIEIQNRTKTNFEAIHENIEWKPSGNSEKFQIFNSIFFKINKTGIIQSILI